MAKNGLFQNIKTILIYRQFRTRAGRQSFGMGTRKLDPEDRSSDFYQDRKMQKLWSNAFERITSSSASSGFGSSGDGANERLRQVATNTDKHGLTLEEQHRMKVSFAEGYLYGQENSKKPVRMRIVTFLREGLTIVIMIVIAYSVLGTGGPFKRVIMGGNTYEVRPEEIDVTFSDVKGCDEAKQELSDIVEFLRDPTKYSRLGGKLPKGVLLVGPPGTGKTLLARAVAGEAGVPFFHASGSEFDEILVGQGARRVRDLFEMAKTRTPCVIFIDEIDSVGGKRTNSVLHPYANQTINQLLSEMDGFNQNEGVIVMGATNRADDLDKALLRPGRFDVRVRVPVPDYKGRRELFEHYLSKIKCSNEVDIDMLCRTTIGFTGADIENLVNQGALKAATDNLDIVTLDSLEYARDKILMGPERKSRIPDEEQNLMTAYHEGGHALVAFYTEKAYDLHKVTIVSRGDSLGHTSTLPDKDMYSQTREQLSAAMDVMLGGRVAEELIYGSDKVTTGCGDDLRKANALATSMVKNLGMSDRVGMRVLSDDQNESQIVMNEFSQSTCELVDAEINRLLEESYNRAKEILTTHKRELQLLAEALLKYETLDAAEVKLIVEGKDIKSRPDKENRDRKGKSSNIKLNNPDRLPLDLLK